MKSMIRVLLLPVIFYLGVYYACYKIFWWAFMEERAGAPQSTRPWSSPGTWSS